MEIKEFIELSVGQWFAQRTSYQLQAETADNSKSEITIEMLSRDNPELVKICQKHQIEPNLTLATKTSWDNSVDWGKPKETGFNLLILVPDTQNHQVGKLLTGNVVEQKIGHYQMGEDEALTLIVEEGNNHTSERLWFASPNLRLRTSLLKNNNNFSSTAFYSEIRRVVTPTT